MATEQLSFDVVIVGGGAAGLGAAIRLRQLAISSGQDLSVCLLEKGATIGAHILSGAILDPRALNSLIPDWKKRKPPITQLVAEEKFLFLTKKNSFHLSPGHFNNSGCYVVSLGEVNQWMAQEAEELGVEIYPGFTAAKLITDEKGSVAGVVTGEMGVDRAGNKKANYQPGIEIKARQTIFAEGCRGHLSQELISRFKLDHNRQPQSYSLGIKELWEVDSKAFKTGSTTHTVGWPLKSNCYGGGFIYHQTKSRVAIGLVIGLNYQNQNIDPFFEMQKFKTHKINKELLQGGRRIAYGARTINTGGVQSLPKLSFPGGLLVGDGAGMLDVGRMKGIHTAIYSGQLAGEAIFSALGAENSTVPLEVTSYEANLRASWIGKDLFKSRNIRPAFKWGLWPGLLYSWVDKSLLRGCAPWNLHHSRMSYRIDQHTVERAEHPDYPQADGSLTFDKHSSLQHSALSPIENQPNHLQTEFIDNRSNQLRKYCPAGVFSPVMTQTNCIHCKTCDIKDFDKNLRWRPPEAGSGANYVAM
ncbi:MAG: 4Fe-4S dicluster domain-containing protein [Magnetococcales bacterium]|nr:4Fe-4S dicluster domain-containing protein [Magnetococcales bacterium]